jgi:hypothetical protein
MRSPGAIMGPVDAVARYRAASAANDIDGLMGTLAADAELVSPVSGRMVFRGPGDLRVLLSAVYGSLAGLQWTEEVGDGDVRVVIARCRVFGVRLGDAMVLELDESGLIRRIRPHLRPWLALTLFAVRLVPKLARRPDVLWRAVRG